MTRSKISYSLIEPQPLPYTLAYAEAVYFVIFADISFLPVHLCL